MKDYNRMLSIGITLLIVGVILKILSRVLENEMLLNILTYDTFVFSTGGAFIGLGLYKRYKASKKT